LALRVSLSACRQYLRSVGALIGRPDCLSNVAIEDVDGTAATKKQATKKKRAPSETSA
jgi:hypothetical protein